MRNPRRWRNVSVVFLISGAVAAPAAFLLPDAAANDVARMLLFLYGVMAIFFGGTSAWLRHLELRAKRAFARGEDVLARWRVDADEWRAFLENGLVADSRQPFLPNEYFPLRTPPAEGVEIIVGNEAVQIEESIHIFPRRGTPEVTHAEMKTGMGGAAYVELRLYYPPGGRGASGTPRPARRSMLRFPVARDARREAEAAVALYAAGRPGKADWFHGRGDGADAEDLSACISCGYTTHALRSHCPQCGAGLQSRRWARRFGFALVWCGLFITGLMGAVLYYAAPLLLSPGETINGTTFSGTATQAWAVFGIMGLVLAFGVTVLLYGAWQVWTGRRNRRVIVFVGFIFAVSCLLARWF